VDALPSPLTWLREIEESFRSTADRIAVTPEQAGIAIRDYVGNGRIAKPNLSEFRGYLKRAASPSLGAKARNRDDRDWKNAASRYAEMFS
jgi:hypothetical protein